MKKKLPVLTQSSIGVLQTCPRKYKLRFMDRLESLVKPNYLAIGSAFHKAVEVLRKGGTLGEMRTAAYSVSRVDLGGDDLCVLTVMVEAYHRKYGHEAAYHEVEKEFSIPLASNAWGVPAHTLAGVVDAVKPLYNKSGEAAGYSIYETKTTSKIDGAYLDRLWSSRQTMVYQIALQVMGFDVRTVVYDIVQKPPTKRLLATPPDKRKYVTDKETGQKRLSERCRDRDETDSEYVARLKQWYEKHPEAFHREEIVSTPEQLEEMAKDICQVSAELEWRTHRDHWPKALGSCYGMYGTPCEFVALCLSMKPELIKDSHYRVREKTHEELEGEKNE